MKGTRVYKISLKSGILRQLIFTDLNLIIVVSLILNGLVLYIFQSMVWEYKLILCAITTSIIIYFATLKIDNRNLIQILPLIFKYFISPKHVRI